MASSYKPVQVVEVQLWGKRIGAVSQVPGRPLYAFEYDPKWLRTAGTGVQPSPLQMPTHPPTVHQFPTLPAKTFYGLPAMLADALPDKFGSDLMDAWLASQGVSKTDLTALDRLAYMGTRGMGALTFKPASGLRAGKSQILDLSEMVLEARKAMTGTLDLSDRKATALRQLVMAGSSAGGARAKLVAAFNEATGELRSGQVDAPDGFEHWLIKLDGIKPNGDLAPLAQTFGRAEFAYYLMARKAGIDMHPCRLLEEGGRAHFMTKRFDRVGNERLHMQSLCAMDALDFNQPATHAYEQLFDVLNRLGLDVAARIEVFRRMVFNIAAVNHDDHTKNVGFLMDSAGTWRLAPAFDLAHNNNPAGAWTYQHLMSVKGKFQDIARKDLLEVGDRFDVPGARTLLDEVIDVVADWPQFAAAADAEAAHAAQIQRDIDAALARLRT